MYICVYAHIHYVRMCGPCVCVCMCRMYLCLCMCMHVCVCECICMCSCAYMSVCTSTSNKLTIYFLLSFYTPLLCFRSSFCLAFSCSLFSFSKCSFSWERERRINDTSDMCITPQTHCWCGKSQIKDTTQREIVQNREESPVCFFLFFFKFTYKTFLHKK